VYTFCLSSSIAVDEATPLKTTLADGQGRPDLMVQLRGLGCKVAGYVEVEPAMDLGGQGKDFGSHGSMSCESSRLAADRPTNPGDASISGSDFK
jgi:hypothetical protein